MNESLDDLALFAAVARAGGFRDAARLADTSPSRLSEAVRRLEARLGVRLLNRTTRSVAPTEAGALLLARLAPALGEIESVLGVVDAFRDRPAGTLRLNVPASAARLVLPELVVPFLEACPEVRLDVVVEESFVDILAAGCDAGIRYGERLEKDMVAVPIGPRRQRAAVAASPGYLARRGRPEHPRDLIAHDCIEGRFASGSRQTWEFEKGGEIVVVEPAGRLCIRIGGGTELGIDAAIRGAGIVALFEDWLRPHFAAGRLVPVLEPWWQWFDGPFLYYPGRRLMPGPLRAFVDFARARRGAWPDPG